MSKRPCVDCGEPTENFIGTWIVCDVCFFEAVKEGRYLHE